MPTLSSDTAANPPFSTHESCSVTHPQSTNVTARLANPTTPHHHFVGQPNRCTAMANRQPATSSDARMSVPNSSRFGVDCTTTIATIEAMPMAVNAVVSHFRQSTRSMARPMTIDMPR